MGVKDYLVVEAQPNEPVQLWWCRPKESIRPQPVSEVKLESLSVTVRVEGQVIRMFDNEGNEILPPDKALERERAKREELERKLAEFQAKLKEA